MEARRHSRSCIQNKYYFQKYKSLCHSALCLSMRVYHQVITIYNYIQLISNGNFWKRAVFVSGIHDMAVVGSTNPSANIRFKKEWSHRNIVLSVQCILKKIQTPFLRSRGSKFHHHPIEDQVQCRIAISTVYSTNVIWLLAHFSRISCKRGAGRIHKPINTQRGSATLPIRFLSRSRACLTAMCGFYTNNDFSAT